MFPRSSLFFPVSTNEKKKASASRKAQAVAPRVAATLFARLISHQPTVLFSHNKSATSNQPAVLFSQNKPAPAISHQPTEQAAQCCNREGRCFPAAKAPQSKAPDSTRGERMRR
jgi:hypothetical protein